MTHLIYFTPFKATVLRLLKLKIKFCKSRGYFYFFEVHNVVKRVTTAGNRVRLLYNCEQLAKG